jgi:hypothetical protein
LVNKLATASVCLLELGDVHRQLRELDQETI